MLLFGGNLAGGGKPPVANSSFAARANNGKQVAAAQEEQQPQETLTPHSDVLHRLTNHELRLLEELERTRSKLQAEWRVKLAELQRDEPEVAQTLLRRGPPSVEQLTQLFLVPKGQHSARPESASQERDGEVKSIMRTRTMSLSSSQRSKRFLPHKKVRVAVEPSAKNGPPSLNREPSLPRIRTNLDVLPILTTAAETAFEVGLDITSNSSPIQSPKQHVLPIFRLPTVNVNATAAAMVVKEVETVEEDRDRKQASETLGLSLEEIEMLEAELNGHAVPRSTRDLTFGKAKGFVPKLPGLAGEKASAKQRTRVGAKRVQSKSASAQHTKTPTASGDRGDALRKELESALYSVQHLTRLVKEDIFSAQKICPASELRTSLYFKRWGREKVENIFRRLLYNFQGVAFARWKQAVAYEKQQEKLQAYLMYKGSKKLDLFLLNWTHRKLRQAWAKWWSDIVHVKALERAKLELDAIRVIQRAVRGYRGRMFARLIRMQKRFALESAAASKIQRLFRGSIVRKFFRLKRLHARREAAAARMQALGRGFLARQQLRQRAADRRRYRAASRIQALYRGRKARRDIAARRRQQKVTTAAILIQRRYRGRLGRAKFLRQQIERYRGKAATRIQKVARGMLARRLLVRLREQRKNELALQNAAATKIQKVYRGHRSRLGTELKLIALREKNKMRRRAAIKIQTAVRCRQARFLVARKKEQRLYGMVQLARVWVEYWSEDTSQWFYFNTQTGAAIWAPPPTGYTKADGLLVLQSGKIIENPADGELGDPSLAFPNRKKPGDDASPSVTDDSDHKDEAHHHYHHHGDEDDDDEDRQCVECEEEDALRKCDQCEDVYCDACYQKLHNSAKREKHTWKAIGTMRCIECEKMKATRWCGECQDPYCLGCFTIIHAKGNKVSHQWTDMAAFRRQKKQQLAQQAAQAAAEENAQTYDEFMRSADYQYVTELTTEEAYTYADPYATDPYGTAASYYSGGGGGSATPVNSVAGSAASVGGGGEEWTTQYDENSGQYYYSNASTGESRWA